MYALRDIETDVAAALGKPEGLPLSPEARESAKAAGTRRVAGIRIFDEAAEQNAFAIARQQIGHRLSAFQNDRAYLVRRLAEHGVTPLAVLPGEAWDAICRNAGLYRLHVDSDGDVQVGTRTHINDMANGIQATKWITAIVAFATLIVAGCVWSSLDMLLGAAPVAVATWFLARELLVFMCSRMRVLFPDGHSGSGGQFRVKVELPQPPAEVSAILARVADMSSSLSVAVHPKAVKVSHTAFRRLIQENTTPADPIVYFRGTSAVAVIAQYGDFPIEREAVEKAIDAGMII